MEETWESVMRLDGGRIWGNLEVGHSSNRMKCSKETKSIKMARMIYKQSKILQNCLRAIF
jgi:hypothetical protein